MRTPRTASRWGGNGGRDTFEKDTNLSLAIRCAFVKKMLVPRVLHFGIKAVKLGYTAFPSCFDASPRRKLTFSLGSRGCHSHFSGMPLRSATVPLYDRYLFATGVPYRPKCPRHLSLSADVIASLSLGPRRITKKEAQRDKRRGKGFCHAREEVEPADTTRVRAKSKYYLSQHRRQLVPLRQCKFC